MKDVFGEGLLCLIVCMFIMDEWIEEIVWMFFGVYIIDVVCKVVVSLLFGVVGNFRIGIWG